MGKSNHDAPRTGRRLKSSRMIQVCGVDPGCLFRGWRRAIPVHTTERQSVRTMLLTMEAE